MKRLAYILGVALIGGSPASADSPDNVPGISSTAPGITPEGALAPISVVEGPGWKVGEGTVLHPIIGMETGFVSNVFYEAGDENPRSSGILRLIAQVGTASLSPQRLAVAGDEGESTIPENRGSFQHREDLRLTYDFYLSGNDQVQEQGGLGVGALFRGHVYPQRTWSFLYLENFQRLIRSTNFESQEQTTRDINQAQLGVQFAPGGRAIQFLLHYQNTLDYFEDDDQHFANRMHHSVGLTGSWRFRPYTVFFADVNQGYYTGFGSDSTKRDSYPFAVSTGVQTLLGINTSVIGRIGYTYGPYSAGPGFSAVMGGLEFGYRYMHTGRIRFLYEYNHQDSINANFFRDHHLAMVLEQQFVPFIVNVTPELRFRRYEGVMQVVPGADDTREDVIVSIAAGARYNFRDWFATVLEYRLSSVDTDFEYNIGAQTDDPSFARHELVLGVRAAL